MRRFFLISSFLTLFAIGSSAQWKPAGDKIKTDWASQINPANVLPEYPRPIMERSDWKNLNGLWNYAVINKGEHLPADTCSFCHRILLVRSWKKNQWKPGTGLPAQFWNSFCLEGKTSAVALWCCRLENGCMGEWCESRQPYGGIYSVLFRYYCRPFWQRQ